MPANNNRTPTTLSGKRKREHEEATSAHPEADRDPDMLSVKMNNVFKKKIVPRFPLAKKRTSSGSSSSMKSSSKSGFSRMRSHETMSFEDITSRVTSDIDKLISAGHINRSSGYKVASLYSKMIQDDLIVNVQFFCTVALRDSVDKVLEHIACDMQEYEKP